MRPFYVFRGLTIVYAIIGMLSFSACEEESEKVIAEWNEDMIMPTESFGVTYYFSDSARLRAQLNNPHVLEKTEEDEGGTLQMVHYFNRGVKIQFFNPQGAIESTVRADKGIFRKERGLAELNENVVVENVKGERLETERLFWDKDIDSVYTHLPVKITTPDRIITGSKGLRSNTHFTAYTIFGIQGEMEMQEEL